MKTRADEKFGLELLMDYLTKRFGLEPVCCKLNENDPPDLVATLANGIQWGVEVTQGHQRVERFNTGKRDSLAGRRADLERFGRKIGDKAESFRKLEYTLKFEPSPLSLQGSKPRLFDAKWKKESEQAILDHIKSGKTNPLKLSGLWLKPGKPGNRWTVAPDAGIHNVASATTSMLLKALSNKACKVPEWNGEYAERWLLILSEYPLAEDADKVRSSLSRLTQENCTFFRFNGILWSAANDPKLVAIPLTGNPPQSCR